MCKQVKVVSSLLHLKVHKSLSNKLYLLCKGASGERDQQVNLSSTRNDGAMSTGTCTNSKHCILSMTPLTTY